MIGVISNSILRSSSIDGLPEGAVRGHGNELDADRATLAQLAPFHQPAQDRRHIHQVLRGMHLLVGAPWRAEEREAAGIVRVLGRRIRLGRGQVDEHADEEVVGLRETAYSTRKNALLPGSRCVSRLLSPRPGRWVDSNTVCQAA